MVVVVILMVMVKLMIKSMVRMIFIRITDHICLLLALKNVALNKVTKQISTYPSTNSDYAVEETRIRHST